jgi:hypothetical protein
MLPDEAKSKWCPFAKVVTVMNGNTLVTTDNRGNTDQSTPINVYCIADSCMCWRWYQETAPDAGGYCGLGGQPARR